MVERRSDKRWRLFWASFFLLTAGWGVALAAPILIDVTVQYTIYDHTGTTALSDGSTVYIMGSLDPINDGMVTVGTPGTNLVAHSTQGDDIFLAMVRIGNNVDPNTGMFQITFEYDSEAANFIYIRFFETTNHFVTGLVYYGVSGIVTIPPPEFGIETVVVDPTTNLVASLRTNFVVIPEPGTVNLVMLVAGMAWAMRLSVKGRSTGNDAKGRGGAG
jgi:hypothetical protein